MGDGHGRIGRLTMADDYIKRDLRGAVSILLGAESVCEECAEKAQKMDVRKIMVERIERGRDDAELSCCL